MPSRIIRWSIENRLLVILATLIIGIWGWLSLKQVPLDAIQERLVVRIEFGRNLELGRIQGGTFLFEVGLANVRTQQRVVRIECYGRLDIGTTLGEASPADLCKPQTQM